MGGTTKRRGVSSLSAFVVVATAVFAALGIALVERETVFEAAVAIRVVSTPATGPITKLSQREIRAALFGLFDATPQDELDKHSPAGAAEAGTDVPAAGEIDGSSIAATRDRNMCLVAIRSGDGQQLAERLNDAARRFVELRNAAAAASVEAELETFRQRTTTRREERDAAARTLAELEGHGDPQTQGSPGAEANAAKAREVAPSRTQENGRALNPQWVLLRDEVSLLEGKLAELRGRFTEQHPEVQHAAAALVERTAQFKTKPQYADGGQPLGDTSLMPAENAASPDPPVAPPYAKSAVETIREHVPVQEARDKLAEADAALNGAWTAEKAATQRQIELAANGPWRFEPAETVRAIAGGTTRAPWLAIFGVALGAGLAASMLARGIAPLIGSPEDAVAALGVRVVGIVRTDDPLAPPPADPGVVSARWLVRAGVASLATIAAVAALAANVNEIGVEEIHREPTLLLSVSRDWLVQRLG
ncbi:MAG: hypothetical protein DCC68_11680 [Planctomycetota bacterium]|nr:MAG: hypothetical protein DCC68_11680 [Planctomycetota bacterium]